MRYQHNRLQQLRGFYYAARTKSMSKAAEEMSSRVDRLRVATSVTSPMSAGLVLDGARCSRRAVKPR